MLPKILLIADVPNWVFDYHSQMLQKYLSNSFLFDVKYRFQPYHEDDYDLIYPFEYDMVNPLQIKNPRKYVTGIRSHISWSNYPFLELVDFLNNNFQAVHVVSKKLYDTFNPYLNNVSYVTHGVDLELFKPQLRKGSPQGVIVAGFSGNRKTPIKGFEEFIEPITRIDGVNLKINGFADINLTKSQMPTFYSSIDVIVSASSYEGNNNTILEAAAMECAIVTTSHGTVPEFLIDGQSALIVERDLHKIQAAIMTLRDNPELRIELGRNARNAVLNNHWGYAEKAREFEKFFLTALNGNEKPALPKKQRRDYQHLFMVIQDQWLIEKELRSGLSRKIFQMTDGQNILDALEVKSDRIAELEKHLTILISLNNAFNRFKKLLKKFKTPKMIDP